MTAPLPPELDLAAACCRWPPSAEGDARIAATATGVRDWECFDAIVTRNRIRPLVNAALRRTDIALPSPLDERLQQHAARAGRRALLLARESVRLQQAFASSGVPVMVIKGAPLAMLAYGDLAMKESVDVDLLIPHEAAAPGRQLLVELGYQTKLATLGQREIASYARYINEAAFWHPVTGINVDLHWKLVPHRRLLAGMPANPPSQEIGIPGGPLRTLADEPLLAYLCVHGSLHNWSRLKWLADVGALLAARPEAEVARLYQALGAYGVGRCATVALLLCSRLFGLGIDEQLLRFLRQDRVAGGLVANALSGLAYRSGKADPDPITLPWLRWAAAQFLLVPGPAHVADQLRVLWNSPTDRAIFLPDRLQFTYHLTRLPRSAARIGRRSAGGI